MRSASRIVAVLLEAIHAGELEMDPDLRDKGCIPEVVKVWSPSPSQSWRGTLRRSGGADGSAEAGPMASDSGVQARR